MKKELNAEIQALNIPVVSCSVVHCKKAPYNEYIGRPSDGTVNVIPPSNNSDKPQYEKLTL